MNERKNFFFIASFLAFAFLIRLVVNSPRVISAQSCDASCPPPGDSGYGTCLNNRIEDCRNKVATLQTQANTLSNQIAQFNAQIFLTQLKINQTQEQIALLGGRIDQLETSLQALSNAFSSRAVATYKMARSGESFFLLITSGNLTQTIERFHYLQKAQVGDHNLLVRLQGAQNVYKQNKTDQEKLQQLLDNQKIQLAGQKAAKDQLLAVTQSDERKYQQLLAQALAEYEAIQGILAGQGQETQVGHVDVGNKIASIIPGSSCNSGGEHLHFMVAQNGATFNPFNYLKSGIDYENCSGAGTCSAGDPFNPSGSWDWPISPRIKFYQGYGATWAVQNTWVSRIYSFHNGIDIDSESSLDVKAVNSGTLYRGSFAGQNCVLRYVRVHHDSGGLDTFYLHVNYVL